MARRMWTMRGQVAEAMVVDESAIGVQGKAVVVIAWGEDR